ncbi:asparagine synthase-related protein [Halorarius litoreus]|uniref:asparagine synthase-related protein n=1 Tax=Halorarius litoreus TaxID=2962676 RepID=UPI0020CC1E2F|nr:asparagine synthase-related protein [Halorarius litoreus]
MTETHTGEPAVTHSDPTPDVSSMQKELFGVFGDHERFDAYRSADEFHTVVSGERVTVGVRDRALGVPHRTTVTEADDGLCVVWGEAFTPADATTGTAEWLLDRYREHGRSAVEGLNGSYLAVLEHDGEALVAGDLIRSWECFYTDALDDRTFGTDATALVELLDETTPRRRSVLEFLHLGTVLGDRTLFEELDRVPFDGYLRPSSVGEFRRFVYDPQPGEYATALADRLTRAIDRRADYPGRTGLLLSAGQDSRTILAGRPDVDHCYTIGRPDSQEVDVARKLATQYDTEHTTLEPGARYLRADAEKIKHTQGLRESLHVHHAGYDDELDVDTMYHGLLYDTLFKGYFLERRTYEISGVEVPSTRLASDVDPVESLLDTLGFMPEGSQRLGVRATELFDDAQLDDPRAFVRDCLAEELAACEWRADSVHNRMDLLVLRNQPVMHFRTHLADNYLESFVAADRELLEWHLQTPPRYRHDVTVDAALAAMDESLLRHRPPSRPHTVELLNQAERFARRKLPLLTPIEPAWPDREELYDRHDLDAEFFPDRPTLHDLPARQKLRVNDLRWWLP